MAKKKRVAAARKPGLWSALKPGPANLAPLSPVVFLPRAAEIFPQRVAVIHGERRITYAQFVERARRLASALAKRGVKRGDVVSAMLPNVPAMLDAHYGVPMLGAVLNAINTRLDADTVAYILEHGEAKVLIADRMFAGVVGPALKKLKRRPLVIDVDDPLYTGPGERVGSVEYESFLESGSPDFAWTLLMATARRLVEADRYVREGRFKQWEYLRQLGGDVHGKTLGVVGFGRIGRAMARRALGFGMRVIYQDAVAADAATERELHATRVDLATLFREADFVTLHTPLIPETRHLMNRETLRALAREETLLDQPPATVVQLAAVLKQFDDLPLAIEVLRRMQRKFPQDFWLNHELACYLLVMPGASMDEVVGFYRAALGFEVAGPERTCPRVQAPAVLLKLDLAHCEAQIASFGGHRELADRMRSLYPLAFSPEEETGICGRLLQLG